MPFKIFDLANSFSKLGAICRFNYGDGHRKHDVTPVIINTSKPSAYSKDLITLSFVLFHVYVFS